MVISKVLVLFKSMNALKIVVLTNVCQLEPNNLYLLIVIWNSGKVMSVGDFVLMMGVASNSDIAGAGHRTAVTSGGGLYSNGITGWF